MSTKEMTLNINEIAYVKRFGTNDDTVSNFDNGVSVNIDTLKAYWAYWRTKCLFKEKIVGNTEDRFDNTTIIKKNESNAEVYFQIENKIEKEFNSFKHYITSDLAKAKEMTTKIGWELSFVQFEKITVELTPSNAVKFKILFDSCHLLTVIKPFEDLIDLNNNEVIFNFYENGTRIIGDTKDISNLVNDIIQNTNQ